MGKVVYLCRSEMKLMHRRQNKYYTQMSKVIWQMTVSPLSCRPHSSAAGTRDTGIVSRYVMWLGSRVVSVLDAGAEGPGFKSQSRPCWVTVLGELFTPIVPLFTKQRNW